MKSNPVHFAGRMARVGRRVFLAGAALSVAFVAAAGTPSDVQIRDRSKIYLGDADRFAKPAVVTAARVYAEITEYQEVKRRQIDRNDPDFYVLMEKAARKFRTALEEAAKSGPYDLVGEKGAVTRTDGSMPDLTDAAVEHVKKLQQS
jgi:hypothetical protein